MAASQPSNWFRRIAYAGFLLWSVTFFWGPTGPYLMIPLLLAWFVYWVKTDNRRAARSPIVWMVCLFALYVIVRGVTGYLTDPSTSEEQGSIASAYLKIGGLWALALSPWLTGSLGARNRNILFGLGLIGFLGEVISAVPWADIQTFTNQRVSTISGPNASASVTGIFFLLVIVVGASVLARMVRLRRWVLAAVGLLVWIALVFLLGFLILASGSRSTWLGLAVVFGLAVPVAFWATRNQVASYKWRTTFLTVGIGFLLVAGGAVSQTEIIQKRLAGEHDTISKVVTLDLENLEPSSISHRIWLNQYGLSKIPGQPVFGYSPGTVEHLIDEAPNEHIQQWRHFHNLYLEIAVGLGLAGFALFFGVTGISVAEVIWAFQSGRLPTAWTAFWLSATAFMGTEMVFNTHIFLYDYGAVMALLGSIGIACHLERLRTS